MTNITSTNMGHQTHQENRTLIATLMFVFATSIPTSRTPTISISTDICRKRQIVTEWLERARSWARDIERDVVALYLAARDPRAPVRGHGLTAAVVAAYALSPIDLIPDFVPVLGYL